MALDVTETLADLVAIPSVNPMGKPVEGAQYFEAKVTHHLQELFSRLGVHWQRQFVHEGRENIVARLDAIDSDRVVLWEAHQDTVPTDGMTIDPWSPKIEGDRLYGRGACDIKGGMAAMLTAFSRSAENDQAPRPTLLMACTVNEEHGYTGAKALRKWWESNDSPFPRRPDVAVVAEPTELDVVVAHKGAVRWRLHATGKACHSSDPSQGENAIYRMARVLTALEKYNAELSRGTTPHPLCGSASLSVGLIRGGLSANTVPDRCTIEVDRRVQPGEDCLTAYREVCDYLAGRDELDFPLVHEEPYLAGPPLDGSRNQELGQSLSQTARIGRPSAGAIIGVPFGTDAATFFNAGVPAVVFGPGSIRQAHTVDEWVSLEQVRLAADILYRWLSAAAS